MEIKGILAPIVGRSGNRVGMTELQVWERVQPGISPYTEDEGERPRGISWLQLICLLLSALFVLQNVFVRTWKEMRLMYCDTERKYAPKSSIKNNLTQLRSGSEGNQTKYES